MIGRVRESRNPKKVIRVTLMESYGEIGRVPVNLSNMQHTGIPVINFLLFIFHFFPHIQICEKPGGVARLFRRRYFVSYGV